MATIEAIYQEIAGTAPDQESVARIRRAGRLLNLTQTDSGWLLLAVLAAHGSLAQANLQSAATLAASLSIATNKAKETTEALTLTTDSVITMLGNVIDAAQPALTGTVEGAARQATAKVETIYQSLGQRIENLGKRTTDALTGRTNQVVLSVEEAISTAAGKATVGIRTTVDTAIGQAVKDIKKAGADLSSGATAAREGTIAEWRAAVVAAVGKELTGRTLIDTEAAKRRTTRVAALACGLVVLLVAGVGYGAHRVGWQDGRRYGIGKTLTQVHDQKARASWANTPDGKLGYQLYQAGSIRELATCDQPGWKTAKSGTVCYPERFKGSTYGWKIR